VGDNQVVRQRSFLKIVFTIHKTSNNFKDDPMDELEQYRVIKSLCFNQLVELRSDPKPTYDIDGQKVSWESYVRSLEHSIDWCDRKLQVSEPYEIASVGVT
jgi:hypothetical protein